MGLYKLGPQIVKDGALYGDGWVKWLKEKSKDGFKVRAERKHPINVFVDPQEALHGNGTVSQLFERAYISKSKLKAEFPDQRAAIQSATSVKEGSLLTGVGQRASQAPDMIPVYEAWHLPSFEGAEDGLHVIIYEKGCLLYEAYTYSEFPFSRFQWKKAPLGFYGIALADELTPSQLQITRLLNIIDKSHIAMGYPKLWVKPGSGFNAEHWTRQIGGVIQSMDEPKIIAQQIIVAEIYNHLDYIFRKCFEISGISQQTASAKKDAGLTSGVAIQAVSDIQSDRLSIASACYEDFVLDSGKRGIEQMKQIYKDNEDAYSVRTWNRGKVITLDWDDVNLEDDAYIMRAMPVGGNLNSYSGKLDRVNTYLQMRSISTIPGSSFTL